jgi:histidine triad (HIT) family protein
MANGAIPVEKLRDDGTTFAIRDINPRAPTHVLVIPREHILSAREVGAGHASLLVGMVALANGLARDLGIAESGYRLAFNVGPDAGMSIDHLHLHLLGGGRLGAEA